jgi:hypothetical protein
MIFMAGSSNHSSLFSPYCPSHPEGAFSQPGDQYRHFSGALYIKISDKNQYVFNPQKS